MTLDFRNITMFCQDWGGSIGLRLVASYPARFPRVVVADGGLPIGTGATPSFEQWLHLSQTMPELPTGEIVNMGTVRELGAAERGAYLAPFPKEIYKEGARFFPFPSADSLRTRISRRESGGQEGS